MAVQEMNPEVVSTLSGDGLGEGRRSFLRRAVGVVTKHISTKIVVPYLVVIFLLAMLGTFIVMKLVAGSLEERLINQLVDAGRKANDAMVMIEEQQLATFRAMAFTQGVDKAVAEGDKAYLLQVLRPLQSNTGFPFVEVIDQRGVHILSLYLREDQVEEIAAEPGIGQQELVRKVLAWEKDALGDKYTALVPTSRGTILYTAGPVRTPQKVVGAILVGMPLEEVLTRLNRAALAAITLYGESAEILGTTLLAGAVGEVPPLDQDLQSQLTSNPSSVYGRNLQLGRREYNELLGRLEIRQQPVLVMGLAYPSDYIAQASFVSRNTLMVLFSVAVFGVLVVGLFLASRITSPLLTLVRATQEVSAGRLDIAVPPTTEDETGVLTVAFNEMVGGLRDRERVKDTFGRYMTREVSDYLLKGEITLGGESRDISILMSDIRGFTTFSETMTPQELVGFLNQYFAGQVEAISMCRGRVDKYMGDAILAVFGAPIPQEDHAARAVLCALKMRENLVKFNREVEATGRQPIRIGIGVNTGPAVVGNIGSEQRLEYTIIGDAVNTTQRIEDLTKEFLRDNVPGWDILISDATYQRVAHLIEVGEPRSVTVRGRTQETAIYPVLRLKDGVEGQLPETTGMALESELDAAPRGSS